MFDFMNNLGLVWLMLIVISSLGLILKAADVFVQGASSISLKLGITPFVVGLTIVAIGTSAPELFVNVIAATSGATDLSIGNILGSNTAGILLGLGISAIMVPLQLKSETVWKEIPFSLLGAIMVVVFGMDKLLDGSPENVLNRSEGIALLFFFFIFIIYTFGLNKAKAEADEEDSLIEMSWLKSIGYIFIGLLGLILSGSLVVESAVGIASKMGLSQNLIGLTIIAAGTSLPEIVTAIIAAKKGHIDMVVGGIVGTIIFNIFFALGVTATVAPLPFKKDNILDAVFLMLITVIFFIFMFIGKKHQLTRWEGICFVLLYIGYISFAVLREVLGLSFI